MPSMTLPHQCNDYDGHEIMRFIMVISARRVEEDCFVVFWCTWVTEFVVMAIRIITVIRDFRLIKVIRVILLF